MASSSCEHYVDLDTPDLMQLNNAFSNHRLIECEQPPAKVENFDAGMRDRTDRAYAKYMAGHATGGIAY